MTREDILAKVQDLVADRLALDADEVKPNSSLVGDLGAESIDFLDLRFELEKSFGIKIADGELFPEGVTQDPRFVKDGKVTAEGIAALSQRLPHVDFSALKTDPALSKVAKVFTVDTLVTFVEGKLSKQG